MAHQRGAFKVNSVISGREVKDCLPGNRHGITTHACSEFKQVKIHARKLAKIRSMHKK